MAKGWLLLNVDQMLQNTELLLCGMEFPGYFLNLLRAEGTASELHYNIDAWLIMPVILIQAENWMD